MQVNSSDSQDKDINDIFDDILLSENHLVEDSYKEGYSVGLSSENIEAYHLGYHRGAELGAEIGYYTAVTDSYLKHLNQSSGNEKIARLFNNLKSLLDSFPRNNDLNVSIVELIQTVRAKFKHICALNDKMAANCTRQEIQLLVNFLEPLLPLANCHMVDFFTANAYKKFIPLNIQSEIAQIGFRSAIDLVFGPPSKIDSSTPHLQQFLENTHRYTLKNLDSCLSLEQFLTAFDCGKSLEKFKLEIFMSPKKSHEVQIMSALIERVTQITGTSHLVDIGDGKGYLSSMLALNSKIPVLGIDSSNSNTSGAAKRVEKLSKIWRNLKNEPKKSVPSNSDPDYSSRNGDLYKPVTEFVTFNSDLKGLVSGTFQSPVTQLGIIGLHTCGNLAPDCLRIFASDSSVNFICNVGCCYHLVDEELGSGDSSHGYPMSDFLSKPLGRSARMIANQSVDRIVTFRELPNTSIYYRALLQIILQKYCETLPTKHVGRFKKCPNFKDYVKKSLKRLDLDSLGEQAISECGSLDVECSDRIDELNIFYLLRAHLAPVVESLILLDRLLFLQERGVCERVCLVQLFDPVISPRCYGLVAIKN